MTQLFVPIQSELPNLDGCREFNLKTDFGLEGEAKEVYSERSAIMVARGNCSFVKKSLNVQRAGAKLALIADNVDEDEDTIIMIDQHNQGD